MRTATEIAGIIVDYVRGTSLDIMGGIEELIDTGEFTQEEFHCQELDILDSVDNQVFTCESCGWTLEVSDRFGDGERCYSCEEEFND